MIRKIIAHKFFTASFWIFLSTGILNVGNYFFHVVLYRILGQSNFGLLESSVSILYMLTIPIGTLTIVVIKYVSYYKGKNNLEAISHFYQYLIASTFRYGIVISVILLLLSPFLMKLLRIPSPLIIILLIGTFLIGILSNINKAFLQGVMNFFGITVSSISDVSSKLFFSIVLVLLGFGVGGALFGIILSSILSYFVSFHFIKDLKPKKGDIAEKKEMLLYAIPAFFMSLAITSLYTSDIILARYFLPSVVAGSYAALSILGKVIVFGVSPLIQVMFPFVSENHARGRRHSHYFFLSLLFTSIGAVFITTMYFLFPKFIVGFLYATANQTIIKNAGFFGLFMSLYAVCAVFINYYLAIHKTKPIIAVSIAATAQVAGIILFHNSIEQIIMVSIVTLFVLLISLLLYYLYEKLHS